MPPRYRIEARPATPNVSDVMTWYQTFTERQRVSCPAEAVMALLPHLTDGGKPLDHERAAVLGIAGSRLVASAVLSTGSSDTTIMCVRQIMRWALTQERVIQALIVGHNHPSGDPDPSETDIALTVGIVRACRMMGFAMRDHIILGDGGAFTSLAETGRLATIHAAVNKQHRATWRP